MATWRELFGHTEPYPNQETGIEQVLETLDEGGYLALEGACGTGKTMLSLTAALHAIRDDSFPYERAFIVTSVKQQLRQFEADLARIYDSVPTDEDRFGAITLVGKADVCPYQLGACGGMTDAVLYDRCEGLRDRTRELIDGDLPALDLVSMAKVDDSSLTLAGQTAPYPSTMPSTVAPGGRTEVEYCPFYAQYLADKPVDGHPLEAVPFDITTAGPLTPADLVSRGLATGSCPHSLMGAILHGAEVVVGNYYHAFDRRTVNAFTGPLFDDRTIFICDEAHMLESRVRDLASDRIALTTIERARDELSDVIEYAKGSRGRGARSVANEALSAAEISRADLSLTHTFLGDVIGAIEAILEEQSLDAETIPLRDPDVVEPDSLTERLEDADHGETTWLAPDAVGFAVERVLNAVDGEEQWRATPTVGRFLAQWWLADHETFFRSLRLEPRQHPLERPGPRRTMRVHVHLDNCVPADMIASTLDRFGGGVLMSATLEPMDIFADVTGLTALAASGRTVHRQRFGLPFPPENRLSLIVNAPKFTYRNRGPPHEPSPVRGVYADTIAAIARSPGNVLVGMPSYAEARWASIALEDRLDRPILLDESSDRATTDDLKERFFAGGPKVLVTSLRGTLTEGVDYAGDRLAAVAICGVPIINTGDPVTKAVCTAYDRRYDDGFDHALVVPAVRKARQALGRVIRGPDEVGIRALVDERYAQSGWGGVAGHLPTREEFSPIDPDDVPDAVDRFWRGHGIEPADDSIAP